MVQYCIIVLPYYCIPLIIIVSIFDLFAGLCGDIPDGFHANPLDCTQFFLCLSQTLFTMYCPPHLEYSNILGYCVLPKDSQCQVQSTPLMPSVDAGSTASTNKFLPSTSQTPASMSSTITTDYLCLKDGFYPDPVECNIFYRCYINVAHRFTCPTGLFYNPATYVCDVPSNVACPLPTSSDIPTT